MGTYNIPRDVKGEGRILYIFSTKALVYTAIGVGIGLIFYFIFQLINMQIIGWFFMILFGLIGFVIATFKMPNIKKIEVARKTSGEKIDDVIFRYVKFKLKNTKRYVLYKGGNKNG